MDTNEPKQLLENIIPTLELKSVCEAPEETRRQDCLAELAREVTEGCPRLSRVLATIISEFAMPLDAFIDDSDNHDHDHDQKSSTTFTFFRGHGHLWRSFEEYESGRHTWCLQVRGRPKIGLMDARGRTVLYDLPKTEHVRAVVVLNLQRNHVQVFANGQWLGDHTIDAALVKPFRLAGRAQFSTLLPKKCMHWLQCK